MKLPFKPFLYGLLALSLPALGQTLNWTGAADGVSWNSPLNWSGGAVPGPANDVVITGGAGTNVVISSGSITVKSIQCTKAFTISGGSLTVTAGGSLLQGAFTMSSGTGLSASGANTTFTCTGPASADNASFSASNGGLVSLPGLANYSKTGCAVPTCQATGAGSVLVFPGLTNITASSCTPLYVQAYAGGQVELTNVVSMDGDINVLADGTNSAVDLSRLALLTVVNGAASFTAQNGGSILLPHLPSAPQASLTSGTGGNLVLTSLTNIDNASLYVSGGAALSLPLVRSYQKTGCGFPTWQANGAGSVLLFPGLTNLTASSCNPHAVQAYAGGRVVLTNVLSTDGDIHVLADGTSSVVDLSRLALLTVVNGGAYFTSQNQGSILLPQLPSAPQVSLTLGTGGNLVLTSLTNIDNASLYVNGGQVLSLPLVRSYQKTGCGFPTWQANGAGSMLVFPGLTNLTASSCNPLAVQAYAGGQVVLANVVSMDGDINVLADGTNSVVDLSRLALLTVVNGGASFTAQNGGSILLPQLPSAPQVSLTVGTGGSVALTSLTNIDNASLYVNGGQVLSVPLVRSYQKTGCAFPTWQANGVGSVLVFPGLTNLTASSCNPLAVQAYAGGRVVLTNVLSMDGDINVLADGTNSVVDLSRLALLTVVNGGASFTARNGGSVLMPQLPSAPQVSLTVGTGGNLMLTSLTNIDDASLYVSGGQVLSLPLVRSYQKTGCASPTWQASGAGSVLTFPGLTDLQSTSCNWFYVQALSGGHALFGALETILDGNGSFVADGSGSVIDLSRLSGFEIRNGQGQLTAQNGGTILFNDQAFLLANVAINIPPGNPVLPPTLIAAPTLTLYGQAWHSYWVEKLDTSNPANGWQFVARVPLTNALQAFAAAPPPNTAYRVREFVADPPILDIFRTPVQQSFLILYGATNKTYQIESTSDLTPPSTWTPGTVVAMTNAFRFLPPEPIGPSGPQQFFQAKQQ